MSGILLDTSAYSAFMRGHPAIKLFIQRSEEIRVTPVVLGELISGFKMGKDERRNRKLLEEFLSSPRVDIVEIDEETSERYAIILNALREKGTPIPTNDIWIASSAMQYGLRVLTTDTHYLQISQVLVECLDQR
jgi:predicted nucleic acid-binding protein